LGLVDTYRRILPVPVTSRFATALGTFAANLLWARVFNRPSPRGPLFATWHLTFDCNAFCRFCTTHKLKKTHPESLGLERSLEICDELAAAGTWVVGFTGGEVLMSPKLLPLIRRLKQRGLMVYIVTNGLLLEERAQELIDSGLDYIVVSLDSDRPSEHDQIRQVDGLHDSACRGIERVRALRQGGRPEIKTTTVMTGENVHRLTEILDFLSTRVDKISVQPICWGYKEHPHGRSRESLGGLAPTVDDRQRVEDSIRKASESYPMFRKPYFRLVPDYWFDAESLAARVPCWSPFLRLSITPEGKALHCGTRFPMIGSLQDSSLMTLWNSAEMRSQRETVRCRRNNCICWSQDTSFNILMAELPLANRLPVLNRRPDDAPTISG